MDFNKLQSALLYDFKSESELFDEIQKLKNSFTVERSKISDCYDTEKAVSAYAAYYFATNYPKLIPALNKMGELSKKLQSCHVVDIGCGPGTFSFGLRDFVADDKIVVGIDSSSLMVKQGQALSCAFKKEIEFSQSLPKRPEGELLLSFGHSINEMGHLRCLEYVKKLSPDYLLIIEPGTKQSFNELRQLRETLLKENWQIQYPCPKSEACPMPENDWCHQYIYVTQEDELARYSQILGINRNLMPVCIQLYARTKMDMIPSKRLLRYYKQTKHSFEWQVCHNNKLEDLEVTKRKLSKADIKKVEKTYPGDEVFYDEIKELPEGRKRVKLTKIKDEDE